MSDQVVKPCPEDFLRDWEEARPTLSPIGRTMPLISTDRLDHVHLYVLDRPAAIAWYRRVLGLKVYGEDHDDVPTEHPVFLAPATGGPHCVSLFIGDRPDGGDRTVAFHASGRVFLTFAGALPDEDLKAHDGTPLKVSHHHDYGQAITFNFLDPAGNHLELVTYDADEARRGLQALS